MATRKRSVKSVSAKGPASNPQLSARTGPIGGTIPTARTGGLPQISANTAPMVSNPVTASAPVANPQLTATPPASNPQLTANMGGMPQLTANSPMPNNVDNQAGMAGQPARVAQPKRTAKVRSARPKSAAAPKVAQAPDAQPSNQAQLQEAQTPPTFNFFFAGKPPF